MNHLKRLTQQQRRFLIFGKHGQLGNTFNAAFANYKNVLQLSSKDINFLNPSSISLIINDFKPDFIINTSAYTDVNAAEENPENAFAINCDALEVMAKAARLNKSVLVHFSTDYIFDGMQNRPYRETDIPNPLNIYGKSKLAGERKVIKSGCHYFIFRVSWLMSEYGTNFIKTIMSKIAENKSLSVVDDQIGSPISTNLVSQITIEILAQNKLVAPKEIFHLSTKGKISWYDIAVQISKVISNSNKGVIINPAKSNQYQSNVKRPMNSLFDHSKVEKNLNNKIPFWIEDITPIITTLHINKF